MSVMKKLMMSGAAGAPEGAWDLSYAYYDPPADLAWNLSTAVYANKSFSVASQESNPYAIFFKPDGTKMYIIGTAGDDVNEYDLSTAWDVSTASYLQKFSVSSQDTAPTGIFFKPDGTKMYVVGSTGDDVNEYDLSTAWDVSTASYLQNFSVAAQDTFPLGIFFKPDGTKMYIIGYFGTDVNEYNLSTAWDVSSASYLQNFSLVIQTAPTDISFKPDGTKMYVLLGLREVSEYNLSTAWDVSSASYLRNFSVSSQLGNNPTGIFFKDDGTSFYIVGRDNDSVYQYTLGGFSVAAQETYPNSVFFKPDGTKMYVVGQVGDDVNEYSLSTAWDTSTATYLQNFSVASQASVPKSIFFKPDGLKFYITDDGTDSVREYSLSVAWDISSSSYTRMFSVASQESSVTGLFFSGDGSKMYITGLAGDNVNEYDLSTAWDVSSASYLQNFSVASQDTAPTGMFFKPDGTKMYVCGFSGQDVNEYDLSTAWDVSSASYLQDFSVASQEFTVRGVFFKDDGTQMFVVGAGTDSVFSYTLGVQP